MKRLIFGLKISCGAGALFTSAVVLAQATKAAAPVQAGAAASTVEVQVPAKLADGPAVAPAKVFVPKGAPPQPAVKGKAKGKMRVGAMGGAVAQPNRDPLIQQSKNQVRPALRAELILVRRVCQVNTEQFRQINRDSRAAVDAVIEKVVDAQIQPRMVVVNGQPGSRLDAGKLLQDALSGVMKKNLTPEQWSRYEVEREKRDAYRKESTLRFLVDVVDRELYLSPEQRTRLREALWSHYDSGWMLYVDYLLFGNQFYPLSVEPILAPILSEPQRKVWKNVQKVDGFWGFGSVWGNFVNDTDELEEELGLPRPKSTFDRQLGIPKK
jgi:hypothetical protein